MNPSNEILSLMNESQVWGLEDTEPLISDYDIKKERWGKGMGGEPDEPFLIGEDHYTITELYYDGYNQFEPGFVEDLMAMKPGDHMKLDDYVEIEGQKLSIRGTFPVLSVKADDRRKEFTIKTKIQLSEDVWCDCIQGGQRELVSPDFYPDAMDSDSDYSH